MLWAFVGPVEGKVLVIWDNLKKGRKRGCYAEQTNGIVTGYKCGHHM